MAIIDWFPFGWIGQDDRKYGMFLEIAELYSARLNTEMDTIVSPVPRVIRGMEEGDFDFTITYRDTGMLSQVDYLGDIGCLRSLIVSFRTAPVTRLEELNGLTVGYPGGGYFAKRFAPKLNLKRLEIPQTFVMLKMALRGRMDAFIVNDAVLAAFRRDLYPDFKVPPERWQDFAPPVVIEEIPFAVSVSRRSQQQALADRMKGLATDADFVAGLARIYEKYDLKDAVSCLKPLP